MRASLRELLFTEDKLYPPRLGSLAAWYDSLDPVTMLAGNGTQITDGGSVALWADKSGNSGVNCLVLPGVAGNYASVPDEAALDITGDFDIRIYLRSAAGFATAQTFVAKYGYGENERSFRFGSSASGLYCAIATVGTALNIQAGFGSAGLSAFSPIWIRLTYDQDNGSGQYELKAWSSTNGTTWSQVGITATGATIANTYAGTAPLLIGAVGSLATNTEWVSGNIYRAQIYASTNGTDQRLDIDFSTAGKKLANGDTFVCATGQTVTLNSSGATGARIAGERDYFQGTLASRGTYNAAGRYIATDGTDDYYKTPLYNLPQPVTLYAVLEQSSWTSGDYLFDGSASDTLALIQTTSTPQINLSAGSSVAANTDLATATKALVTIVSNGASSLVSINRLAATTGNAGAGVPNGLTLAAKGTPGSYGNARYYEIAVYNAAHDRATRHRFALYVARKWGFAA